MVSTWLVSAEEGVQLVTWTIEDHVQCSKYRWQVVRRPGVCGQAGAAWIKAHLWDTILNWTVSKTKKQTKIYQRAIILIYCLNPDFSRCRFHETTTIIKSSHIEMYIIRNRAIKKRSNPIEILVLIQKYLQRLDNSFI